MAVVNSASLFDYDTPPDVSAEAMERHARVNLNAPVRLACALAEQDDLAEGAVVALLDQKVANLNPDFFAYSAAPRSRWPERRRCSRKRSGRASASTPYRPV